MTWEAPSLKVENVQCSQDGTCTIAGSGFTADTLLFFVRSNSNVSNIMDNSLAPVELTVENENRITLILPKSDAHGTFDAIVAQPGPPLGVARFGEAIEL